LNQAPEAQLASGVSVSGGCPKTARRRMSRLVGQGGGERCISTLLAMTAPTAMMVIDAAGLADQPPSSSSREPSVVFPTFIAAAISSGFKRVSVRRGSAPPGGTAGMLELTLILRARKPIDGTSRRPSELGGEPMAHRNSRSSVRGDLDGRALSS
jgi:hypothetical protein